MKKVSLVIPTFNQGEYLPACVDHCLFQTYPDLEIIIVDGGSTDNTKEYLGGLKREVAERTVSPVAGLTPEGEVARDTFRAYPRTGREISIVAFDRDIGPTATYNQGLKRVTGEYCTYVVGDDLPHPHMVEDLVAFLEETGADFVYSDMDVVTDQGKVVRHIRLPDYDFTVSLGEWYRLGVSHLYRSVWHERVGLMDESYQSANDYDHYLRMAMAGASFAHLPRVLYSVRHHGDRGQHSPERYPRLIEESRRCSDRARAFWEKAQ